MDDTLMGERHIDWDLVEMRVVSPADDGLPNMALKIVKTGRLSKPGTNKILGY